jgi:uncharacterized protein (TIGR03435 family)
MARLTVLTVLFGVYAWGQSPAPISFEAVSIRAHADSGPRSVGNGVMAVGPRMTFSGPRVTIENQGLQGLIAFAYNLNPENVSGAPRSADVFDIVAKAAGEGTYTRDQFRRMFQTLLADRFKLKSHLDTKDTPGYTLVVARNGPKLKESPPDAVSRMSIGGTTYAEMTVSKCTMEQLARQLSVIAGPAVGIVVPVVDKTGLTGTYDFKLKWADDQDPRADPTLPPLLTALQEQLGLKLESSKVPVRNLVIDSIDRPSEN